MKKIIFTAQVLSLIALFPLVVILEMTHIPGRSSEIKSPSGVIKNTEKVNLQLPKNEKDKMVNEAFIITLKPLFLKNEY